VEKSLASAIPPLEAGTGVDGEAEVSDASDSEESDLEAEGDDDVPTAYDDSFLVTEKVLEKIVAYRVKRNSGEQAEGEVPEGRELEFLIKWKGMSYLHTEWFLISVLYAAKWVVLESSNF